MKVILLKEVEKVGKSGDEVEVASGYARNFLFPRKLAVHVTSGSLGQAKKLREQSGKKQVAKASDLAKMLNAMVDKTLVLNAKASSAGTLFAAIDAEAIVGHLAERGMAVSAESIILSAPIKKIGDHKIDIVLHAQPKIVWTVRVNAIEEK